MDERGGEATKLAMVTIQTRICPNCKAPLVLALPPGGKGERSLQCFDCERPDPLKSGKSSGWLQGELRRPQ
jgi:hypothetical protein